MSPTVLRAKGYRLFFFSREEARIHVHVSAADGEAKFWPEPGVELAYNYNLKCRQLREVEAIITEHFEDIINAWRHRFGG